MTPKVFISQRAVDGWIAAEQADLSGPRLLLRDGPALAIEPAVLFVSVAGGTDSATLLGRVKAQAALGTMGGELYMSSVILGDTAYEVETGFLATVSGPADVALAALRALAN